MLSPENGPLGELILTACRVEVASHLQELLPQYTLLRRHFRRLDGQVVEQGPYLESPGSQLLLSRRALPAAVGLLGY